LRLIFGWMRQWSVEHVLKVPHIDPAAAGRAAHEMLGLVLGLAIKPLPMYLPRGTRI
jgi:hypothetical protein